MSTFVTQAENLAQLNGQQQLSLNSGNDSQQIDNHGNGVSQSQPQTLDITFGKPGPNTNTSTVTANPLNKSQSQSDLKSQYQVIEKNAQKALTDLSSLLQQVQQGGPQAGTGEQSQPLFTSGGASPSASVSQPGQSPSQNQNQGTITNDQNPPGPILNLNNLNQNNQIQSQLQYPDYLNNNDILANDNLSLSESVSPMGRSNQTATTLNNGLPGSALLTGASTVFGNYNGYTRSPKNNQIQNQNSNSNLAQQQNAQQITPQNLLQSLWNPVNSTSPTLSVSPERSGLQSPDLNLFRPTTVQAQEVDLAALHQRQQQQQQNQTSTSLTGSNSNQNQNVPKLKLKNSDTSLIPKELRALIPSPNYDEIRNEIEAGASNNINTTVPVTPPQALTPPQFPQKSTRDALRSPREATAMARHLQRQQQGREDRKLDRNLLEVPDDERDDYLLKNEEYQRHPKELRSISKSTAGGSQNPSQPQTQNNSATSSARRPSYSRAAKQREEFVQQGRNNIKEYVSPNSTAKFGANNGAAASGVWSQMRNKLIDNKLQQQKLWKLNEIFNKWRQLWWNEKRDRAYKNQIERGGKTQSEDMLRNIHKKLEQRAQQRSRSQSPDNNSTDRKLNDSNLKDNNDLNTSKSEEFIDPNFNLDPSNHASAIQPFLYSPPGDDQNLQYGKSPAELSNDFLSESGLFGPGQNLNELSKISEEVPGHNGTNVAIEDDMRKTLDQFLNGLDSNQKNDQNQVNGNQNKSNNTQQLSQQPPQQSEIDRLAQEIAKTLLINPGHNTNNALQQLLNALQAVQGTQQQHPGVSNPMMGGHYPYPGGLGPFGTPSPFGYPGAFGGPFGPQQQQFLPYQYQPAPIAMPYNGISNNYDQTPALPPTASNSQKQIQNDPNKNHRSPSPPQQKKQHPQPAPPQIPGPGSLFDVSGSRKLGVLPPLQAPQIAKVGPNPYTLPQQLNQATLPDMSLGTVFNTGNLHTQQIKLGPGNGGLRTDLLSMKKPGTNDDSQQQYNSSSNSESQDDRRRKNNKSRGRSRDKQKSYDQHKTQKKLNQGNPNLSNSQNNNSNSNKLPSLLTMELPNPQSINSNIMTKGPNAGMKRLDGSPSLLGLDLTSQHKKVGLFRVKSEFFPGTSNSHKSGVIKLPGILGMGVIQNNGIEPIGKKADTQGQKSESKRDKSQSGGISRHNQDDHRRDRSRDNRSRKRRNRYNSDSEESNSDSQYYSDSDQHLSRSETSRSGSNQNLTSPPLHRRGKNNRSPSNDPVLNDLIEKVLKQQLQDKRRGSNSSISSGLYEDGLGDDNGNGLDDTGKIILQYLQHKKHNKDNSNKYDSRSRGRKNRSRDRNDRDRDRKHNRRGSDDSYYNDSYNGNTNGNDSSSSSCRSVDILNMLNQRQQRDREKKNRNRISGGKKKFEFVEHAKIHQPKNSAENAINLINSNQNNNNNNYSIPQGLPPTFYQGSTVQNLLLKDFMHQNSDITGAPPLQNNNNNNNPGGPGVPLSLEDSLGIGQRIQVLNGLNASRNKWTGSELKKMKDAGVLGSQQNQNQGQNQGHNNIQGHSTFLSAVREGENEDPFEQTSASVMSVKGPQVGTTGNGGNSNVPTISITSPSLNQKAFLGSSKGLSSSGIWAEFGSKYG